MPRIIYISMDGLRSGDPTQNLQTLINAGLAPNFARLQQQGAWTFAARTDPIHTNTLPNHSTMVTGRPVEDASGAPGHRYRYNDDPEDVPTGGLPAPGVNLSTLHTSAGEYIPGVFNVVHDNGRVTAMYASKSKFSLYDASYDGVETPGAAPYERMGLAQDTIGPDNGFDKIDRFFIGGVAGAIDRFLADAAAGGLPAYTFIHIAAPDSAGHASGWGSPEYLAAIRASDAQLGRVFALLDGNADLAAETFLIVSADHGGGGDEPVTDAQHGNPNSPLNFTIPFFVYGPDVAAGADLYALNDPRRDVPPADQNPSIIVASSTGVQVPIRNGDSANFALDLLGFQPVPTSSINARQDLNVFDVALAYGTGGNDVLTGGAGADGLNGEDGDDRLAGGAGNDVLKGGAGNDVLDGGLGDDRLNGNIGSDTADYLSAPAAVAVDLTIDRAQNTVGAGFDTLTAIENLAGSAFADTLRGDAGNNVIDGRGGNDLMEGRGGDDFYYVDTNGDVVIEAANGGADRVFASRSFTLTAGAHVEKLTTDFNPGTAAIDLTGNALAQAIFGNAGPNVLDGGGGVDSLIGFEGDDQFYVDADDTVFEAAGGGFDRVFARTSYTLGAGVEVEKLTTDFNPGTAAIDLTGNALAQAIFGNAGRNVLDGGGGVDSLIGFEGDDQFYVDADDTVFETAGGGFDRVFARTSYTLGAGVEVEMLTTDFNPGTAAIDLTGNELANWVYGNAGANILNGKGGADSLTGFEGADTFVFDTDLGDSNVDYLSDFASGTDRIQLSRSVFAGLGLGTLSPEAFVAGAQAQDANDRIIYNQATGALLYDADGSGTGAAVQFAALNPGTALSANDIFVV